MLLDYRKDIDGLRAVAVMLVVLFHAGLPVSGGFIGIDVFFVISGFLIASLIQKQILRGKFTFKGFYLHRMRRILPVLITVIFTAVLIFGTFISEREFLMLTRQAFYSIISLSNMFFIKNTGGYFDVEVDQIPLLHTWSLSVEEQFYIFVPIFLIILFKYFYKTKWFNYILLFVLVLSFSVSQYLALEYPKWGYYSLPARFFELFLGVVLALNYQNVPISKNKYISNILGVLGLLLILIPAFVLSKESIFPGVNAFYVCFGSALIIYLGKSEKETLVTKLLSTKIFVWIGLISYSLYLWHWLFFVVLNIIGIKLNIFASLGVILFLIFWSYMSWKFIEQPFRKSFKWSFMPTSLLLFIIPVCLLFGLKKYNYEYDGISDIRFAWAKNNLKIKSYNSGIRMPKKKCVTGSFFNCIIGNQKLEQEKVLIYGDSHAGAITSFIDLLLKDANIKGRSIYKGGVFYLNDYDLDSLSQALKKDRNYVKETKDLVDNALNKHDYDYVILAGFYNGCFYKLGGYEKILQSFRNTLDMIISKKAIPIIVKDILAFEKGYIKCLANKDLFEFSQECNRKFLQNEVNRKYFNKIFDILAKEYPNLIFIDPKDVMYKNGEYQTVLDDYYLYADGHHLTYLGSQYLGKLYLEKIGNPFKEK